MYAQVVFPLKLPPLTYRIPEAFPHDIVGKAVEAPLMGRRSFGLVTAVADEASVKAGVTLKEITGIFPSFADDAFLSFLSWLSDYYLVPMGIALKACFFEDIVRIISSEKAGSVLMDNDSAQFTAPQGEPQSPLPPAMRKEEYKGFLLHAGSSGEEQTFLLDLLCEKKRGIILAPEITHLERLAGAVREAEGERVALLHSRLTKKKRSSALERILSGEADIVIGTRSAVLVPMRQPSFIAVVSEHSPAYKGMEGMRYHGRDIAVMRGFRENCPVLLSSISPSAESVYNCRIGKYTLIDRSEEAQRPQVRVMDMRRQRTALSPEALKKTEGLIRKGEKVLFLMNRKGYSLLRCGDCGHIPSCPDCSVPLVFYKEERLLRCPSCGHAEPAPEQCGTCGGFDMKVIGAGTERVSEELESALDMKGLLIEKGALPKQEATAETVPFVVGTSMAMRKVRKGLFSSAVVLNTDILLSLPDFRAQERVFQEIIQVSQMMSPEGTIFLQTQFPGERILGFIRRYDFAGFYDAELSLRREMGYPPFSRIIAVSILVREETETLSRIREQIPPLPEGVVLMGPVEAPSHRKGWRCLQLILKSPDRRPLHAAAREIAGRLESLKTGKIIIDVDPLRI
ncbi:MAG: primosomal protein N' [Nitrospirales bacterium]|nr:primosomal protein N' [Nitrospirales bacterium]